MKKRESSLVYSTDPQELARLQAAKRPASRDSKRPNEKQTLTVMRSRKGRKGKVVTLVTGAQHCPEALGRLAKSLKQACGAGGSVKAGEIIVQGDHREKIVAELKRQGYIVKVSGG